MKTEDKQRLVATGIIARLRLLCLPREQGRNKVLPRSDASPPLVALELAVADDASKISGGQAPASNCDRQSILGTHARSSTNCENCSPVRDSCDDVAGHRPDRSQSRPPVPRSGKAVLSSPQQQRWHGDANSKATAARVPWAPEVATVRGSSFTDHFANAGRVLGKGTSSHVFLVESKRAAGAFYASKVVPFCRDGTRVPGNGESTRADVESEIAILRHACGHPNIIKLEHVFWEPELCRLVTPVLRGGDLLEALQHRGSLTEGDARTVMTCLFSALRYLHSSGVAHRDVKLENLVLRDENAFQSIQLIDFGLAHRVGAGCLLTPGGTPLYVAPEIITWANTERTLSKCGVEGDMWSCGVLLYMLLGGSPPFGGESPADLFDSIRSGAYNFRDPAWSMVSPEAKHLIVRLLDASPKTRITAAQALRHPWVAEP